MQELKTVSIIIPAYNVEKYIGRCLDSILAQTLQDFEVIVIDDYSCDNTRNVVLSYVQRDNRVRLICQGENKGPMMARSSEVNIDIFGKTSHAAKYKEGIDALEIGARYLLDLYQMESQIDPKYARLLRFGRIESGTVRNVVSDHCHLEGTMRSLDEDIYQYLKEQLYSCAKAYQEARFEFSISEGYPVVFNDKKLVRKVHTILDSLSILDTHEMISEDFSWYQQYVPGVFFFLGTGTNIPLHNSHFDFDEEILLQGIQAYIQIVKNA